jgi:hypothetical protein
MISASEAGNVLVAHILGSLTWRSGVLLSSSSLTRGMQPFIIISFGFWDGSFGPIELNVKAFHDLHFHVAEPLHSLQKLESNSILSLRIS